MTHAVVHFEIMGGEGDALQRFYADAFGWAVNADNPMNYGVVPAADGGIGGGIGPAVEGASFVTVYVQVDDLQAALDTVEAAGGKTLMAPTDVPGGPELALFTDPAGNRMGLVRGM